MLHKNKLVNLEQKQSTGALMRLWREKHMTGPLVDPSLYERDTQEMPAVAPRPAPSMPRFVDYRTASYGEDCLMMLFGACLLCLDTYGVIPEELYVTSDLVPRIARRTQNVCGVAYNGRYRFFSGGDLRHIPVRSEAFLPPIIKLAVYDRLSTDQVIGLIRG